METTIKVKSSGMRIVVVALAILVVSELAGTLFISSRIVQNEERIESVVPLDSGLEEIEAIIEENATERNALQQQAADWREERRELVSRITNGEHKNDSLTDRLGWLEHQFENANLRLVALALENDSLKVQVARWKHRFAASNATQGVVDSLKHVVENMKKSASIRDELSKVRLDVITRKARRNVLELECELRNVSEDIPIDRIQTVRMRVKRLDSQEWLPFFANGENNVRYHTEKKISLRPSESPSFRFVTYREHGHFKGWANSKAKGKSFLISFTLMTEEFGEIEIGSEVFHFNELLDTDE